MRCSISVRASRGSFRPHWRRRWFFSEDKLLPSTSNVVKRGNRQYRKMQKNIYSVQTQEHIKARIALDMWREAQGEGRDQTLRALHEARARRKLFGDFATVSNFPSLERLRPSQQHKFLYVLFKKHTNKSEVPQPTDRGF